MSMNQHRGKEQTENFKNVSVEEQKKLSKENMGQDSEEPEVNTGIAQEQRDKLEKEQARKIH